jgi:hypothetical protein
VINKNLKLLPSRLPRFDLTKNAVQLCVENPLTRKPWIEDVSVDDMSMEQKQEYEDFEKKWEKIEGEIKTNRATLETELKTIRSDVIETVSQFHTKMKNLAASRNETDNQTGGFELYMLSLASMMNRHMVAQEEMQSMALLIQRLKARKGELEQNKQSLSDEFAGLKAKMKQALEEDRDMVKNFRKNLQKESSAVLDQDLVDMLLTLFHDREKRKALPPTKRSRPSVARLTTEATKERRSIISRYIGRDDVTWRVRQQNSVASGRSSTTESNNPYGENLSEALLEAQNNSSEARVSFMIEGDINGAVYAPLSLSDVPDHFEAPPRNVWEGVQKLRDRKIKQEAKLDALGGEIKLLKKESMKVKYELEQCNDTIEDQKVALKQGYEFLVDSQKKATVLMQLEEGQDEVGVQHDRAFNEDTVLVPVSLVEDMNVALRQLHEEGQELREKTNRLDKKIESLKWENEYLDLVLDDAKETIVDYQYLRVDGNLKALLSGEKKESDQVKAAKAKALNDKRQKGHNFQVARMKASTVKLDRDLSNRLKENKKLEAQLEQKRETARIQRANDRKNDSKKVSTVFKVRW